MGGKVVITRDDHTQRVYSNVNTALRLEPINTIDRIAEEFAGEITVCKMNVDENKTIPAGLGIRSIPALFLFKGGNLLETLVGAPDPAALVEMLEKALEEGPPAPP